MDITFTTARRAPANAAVVAHGLTTEGLKSPPEGLDPNTLGRLGFTADSGQVQMVPAGERLVAAVGLGAADGVDLGTLRKAGAALARAVRRQRSVATDLATASGLGAPEASRAVVEGMALAL